MKRKPAAHQQIYNVYTLEPCGEYFKLPEWKGKVFQKLFVETKFKRLKVEEFPAHCVNADIAQALTELGRVRYAGVIQGWDKNNVVVYKHLIREGYKVRPYQKGSIAMIDAHGIEHVIEVHNTRDCIDSSITSQVDGVSYIAVVQDDVVVFLSCRPFSL